MQLNQHELYYSLGCTFYQQSDLVAAADSYRQAIALQPDFAVAHHDLGIVLDFQGQWSLAVQSYRQAIALLPKYTSAYSNLGCTLAKLGQLSQAVESYQQAITLSPTWSAPYHNLGQALLAQGKVDLAIAAFLQAIKLQPDMVAAHHGIARGLQLQGQHTQAQQYLHRAVELAPDQVKALGDYAVALMAEDRLEQAIPYLQAAIAQRKPFIEAYCSWVSHLTEQDELTLAKVACGHLLSALQLEKTDISVIRVLLQQIYICFGKAMSQYGGYKLYQRAEAYYRKALKLQPQTGEVSWLLGNCLTQQGRLQESVKVYREALAAAPTCPHIYFRLGKVLEKLKQPEEAINCYRQTLALQQAGNRWAESEREIEIEQLSPYPLNVPSYRLLFPDIPSSTADTAGNACDGLNCLACLERIFDWFQPLHLGGEIYACSKQAILPAVSSPLFTAMIPGGRIWIAPQQNFWLVCNAIATLTPDHHLLLDLSPDYPGQLPSCQNCKPTYHRIFELEAMPHLEQIDGMVAVLAGLSGNFYFHWMADVLPRIAVLQQSGIDLKTIDWFLINSDRQPFQRETLEILGIPIEKRLLSDAHPHIQAQRLLVPAFPDFVGWMQPWALNFLRQTFLPRASQKQFPERIYISRAGAKYRRVLNEEQVIESLGKAGFVSVALESFAFADQVALFANAKAIVAPHGGGLTNLIFCNPGTQIVEFFSPHYVRHYYWVISNYLKLDHYYLLGEGLSHELLSELMYQSPLTEDFLINLNSLQRMMKFVGL